MKIAVLPLCFLLFQTCTTPDTTPAIDGFTLPDDMQDTTQFIDFERHMAMHGENYSIPRYDSMYCFRSAAGWGQFDRLCAVYRDSSGYKATYRDLEQVKGTGHDCRFWEQIKPIDALIWKQVQAEFQKQDFWQKQYKFDCDLVDGEEDYVWGREGHRFRLINWDECSNHVDSLVRVARNIWNTCVGPTPSGVTAYSIRGDSLYAEIYTGNRQPAFFIKRMEVSFAGKELPMKEGVHLLVLPKILLDRLQKVQIVEYGIDGSRRSFHPGNVYKTSI